MHPDSPRAAGVRFPNVNVVLGANGVGKTTLLKAAALATLNPVLGQTGFRSYALVRRVEDSQLVKPSQAFVSGMLKIHGEESPLFASDQEYVTFSIEIRRHAESEQYALEIDSLYENLYEDKFPLPPEDITKLFSVAYGAMRRVERLPSYDLEAQNKIYSYNYSKLANLFDSTLVLTPLISWLLRLPKREKKQILELFASLMPAKLEFSDSIDGREFSFYHNKILVPFDALADGHRSYIGWVSDLLYHLHRANPKNVQDVHGVVLVDEVDLLAHPTWQRTIVPDLSKAFPKLQFILTTHSPIVAASVEAANLLILEPGRNGTARLTRPDSEVYGLNAQQVLHEVFGMDSTRAPDFDKKLKTLAKKSRGGDRAAAQALMQGLAYGAGEPVQLENDSELASIQKAAKALLESDS